MKETVFNIPGTDFSICIKEGDLLEQEGLKIVHCPRTFDTCDEIVPVHSVFGKFLNVCRNSNVDIDAQIDLWTNYSSNRAVKDDNRNHRKLVFEVGELCPIVVAEENYCVAAFSKTDSIFSAQSIEFEEYVSYWRNLWENLATLSVDRETVNVAVPGDRLVNIAAKGFPVQQKVGIIVNTFFQHISHSGVCKHLNICLYGKNAECFDYVGWEKSILPYLEQLSHLPIEWNIIKKPAKRTSLMFDTTLKVEDSKNNIDVHELFINDLREMINNIGKHAGEEYVQFEGSRKVSVVINANIDGLYKFVDWLESNDQMTSYFIKKNGSKYDKNKLFELIGAIHDSTLLFGSLNRRSIIKLALDENGEFTTRWSYLGDNIDNIINYVGQKLAHLKKNNQSVYNNIWRALPLELRKK